MKDKWSSVLISVLIALGAILIGIGLAIGIINSNTKSASCHYEWEDALGNYGTATSCQTYKGHLICSTKDTRRKVINYTYICEK